MAKQRFLNNFTSTFIAAVKDAPSSGTPETELDYGVLRISDGAAGSLINPTDGDYYLLTAFKRSGSVESNIEVMRVTGVNNATPGECRITVQRAQEGTSAKAFVAGDYLSLRITKGTAENFSQPSDLATKEPVIAAPGSSPTEKYWRGDKTWRDFFTDVRAATLTGLSTATNAVVAATDTVLAAIGKLQAQVGAKFDKTGGDISGNVNLPSLNGGQLAGLRNKIINGGFDVWQRGASRSVGTGVSSAYLADRWMGVRSGFVPGATVSQQPAGLTGFRYCARVQRDSGNADTAGINLEQDLETSTCIPFQGAAVTLSFYARCGANYSASASALAVRLVSGTGTDQNALVGTFTGVANAVDSTATLTTTWQRFSYTVTIGAGVTQLGTRFIHTPTGTAGAADYFEITGVQLEISSVATPFEHRPYGMELALCQRYYYRLTSNDAVFGPVFSLSTNNKLRLIVPFPVSMRAAPAALEQTGTAVNYGIFISGATTVSAAVPVHVSAATWLGHVELTASSGHTAGQAGSCYANAEGTYLGWSAEL